VERSINRSSIFQSSRQNTDILKDLEYQIHLFIVVANLFCFGSIFKPNLFCRGELECKIYFAATNWSAKFILPRRIGVQNLFCRGAIFVLNLFCHGEING
jgi:hypothetical protein